MKLGDILAMHRAFYLDDKTDTGTGEAMPAPLPELSRATAPAYKEPLPEREAASRQETVATQEPEPLAIDMGEIVYPEPSSGHSGSGEDAVERFTRVLRWNERLYSQPMDEEG